MGQPCDLQVIADSTWHWAEQCDSCATPLSAKGPSPDLDSTPFATGVGTGHLSLRGAPDRTGSSEGAIITITVYYLGDPLPVATAVALHSCSQSFVQKLCPTGGVPRFFVHGFGQSTQSSGAQSTPPDQARRLGRYHPAGGYLYYSGPSTTAVLWP